MAIKAPAEKSIITKTTAIRMTSSSPSLSPSSLSRRPTAVVVPESPRASASCAELAGGTTAECAAVICCCPCGLLNLLVLTFVRLPAGLCHRAVVKRRRKKRANASSSAGSSGLKKKRFGLIDEDDDSSSHAPSSISSEIDLLVAVRQQAPEIAEIEKEMLARFYGTGFWRSPSQRDEPFTL